MLDPQQQSSPVALPVRPHLWQVEAPDPRPPGDFAGVKQHWLLVGGGDGALLKQLAASHFSINDLQQ